MDYAGYPGYPVNRKLTEEERSNRFLQGGRIEVTPFYNLSVIRLNSACLECVDRWFSYRGPFSAFMLVALGITLSIFFPLHHDYSIHYFFKKEFLRLISFSSPFLLAMWALIYLGIRKESFRWTHYPIRLDHRNRMVYVFRKKDGSVLRAKWDDIFFTLGRCQIFGGKQNWDIRGHVLDADGETVLETFAFPGDSTNIRELKHGWEFFRRYMEDGAAEVYQHVYWCHDIATRRESFRAGLTMMFYSANGLPFFPFLLAPLFLFCSLGRWFAMRTSKIPVWPEEIEAQCAADSFDPYLRDASRNPPKIPTQPLSLAKVQDD